MSEPTKNPFDAMLDAFRQIVREELQHVATNSPKELLEPEELAQRLNVPVSWVYEQSRHGNIPTHRIGKYIRFELAEVIESQKKKNKVDLP